MTIFRMTALVILLSLGLSACAGIAERRAERRADRALADRSECLAMGFEAGTDTFLLCLDNRNIMRAAKKAKRAANEAKRAADDAAWEARQAKTKALTDALLKDI